MIYFLTVCLSLIRTWQELASGTIAGDIDCLERGRSRKRGFLLFPIPVPMVQSIAVGGAFLLEVVAGVYAIWIVIGYYFVGMLLWVRRYRELSIRLDTMLKDPYRHKRKKKFQRK